jgi:hypothetical protein
MKKIDFFSLIFHNSLDFFAKMDVVTVAEIVLVAPTNKL